MKKRVLLFLLTIQCLAAGAQTLGGYTIYDYLVEAWHPYDCNYNYITGPPDLLTWVNMPVGTMTGTFGSAWTDAPGDELLLETSFHADNYNVRLILSNGLFSENYNVVVANWIQIENVLWDYSFGCSTGSEMHQRYIHPLDFDEDFGLTAQDTVVGIEITFLTTNGLPDLAGVYITDPNGCQPADFGEDLSLCVGDTLVLNAATADGNYLWQDGSTNPSFTVTESGTYWVLVNAEDCNSADTINVTFNPVPEVDLAEEITLCAGDSALLNVTTENATYLWQDGTISPTFTVTEAGVYTVMVSLGNCSTTETTHVNYINIPEAHLGDDQVACDGQELTLNAGVLNANYLWPDGSGESHLQVSHSGMYWVEVSNVCGSTKDSIHVAFNPV